MKEAKLYLAFLLIAFATVIVSACSSEDDASSQSEGKSAESAQSQSDFPTKNITFIVPVSPGGGFDTITRMLVPYWEKALPGDHKIIVKNMPGGSWNIGLSALAKGDGGYTVGVLNMPGNVMNQLLGKANYDLKKFVPLGRMDNTVYVMAASKASGIKSIKDIKKKGSVKVGTVSLSSTAGLTSVVAMEAIGAKVQTVPHDGSAQAIVSGIRGSVDLVQYPYGSLKKHIVDSDDLTPIVVYTQKRLKTLPDTPTIGQAGYPKLADVVQLNRIVVASPDTTDAQAKILRSSLKKALNNEEFKKKMIERSGSFEPAYADKAGQIIDNSFDEMAKYKDDISKRLSGY